MAYSISWHTKLGPWDVQYPVRFYDGGDTSTQAFEKHIQEIIRIYGLLNALDEGKLDIGDFEKAMDAHIQDADPHPNLQHNTLRGKEGGGSGHYYHMSPSEKSDLDDMRGIIQGMIDDAMEGAGGGDTPNHEDLPGLLGGDSNGHYHLTSDLLNKLMGLEGGGGGGSTTPAPSGLTMETGNGYVKFSNGFVIMWGTAMASAGPSGNQTPIQVNGTGYFTYDGWNGARTARLDSGGNRVSVTAAEGEGNTSGVHYLYIGF